MKYTYPQSCTLYKDGKEILNVLTQLYKIGVYAAIYTPCRTMPEQLSMDPRSMKKYMKQFGTKNLKKGVTAKFGPDITVSDESGFWEKADVVTKQKNKKEKG